MNPITAKRLRLFRSHRRGWYSFCLLVLLYAVSLFAELLCNGVPLVVRHNGHFYFPVFRFYPESAFYANGKDTRVDYRKLQRDSGCWMLWPLISHGPNDICSAEELEPELLYIFRQGAVPRVCAFSVDENLVVSRVSGESLLENPQGKSLTDLLALPNEIRLGIKRRFANIDDDAVRATLNAKNGAGETSLSLSQYKKRANPPKQVRVTLRVVPKSEEAGVWKIKDDLQGRGMPSDDLFATTFAALLKQCREAGGELQSLNVDYYGVPHQLTVEREKVRFPFRPVAGHPLGLDDAGRDVLARLLYAFRTSLTFGIILVVCSMTLGSLVGMLQGYVGGWVDLGGQRLLEIWSALPFLYIIILLGSIYGPGFWLMIFCYAIFNWIGLSYYMRAEMLRLRKLPFVEAAKCLGLPWWRIVTKHILPNALVPLITFFPFSLVGAIGSLAALDYLGFGLPPPTPSIGQLLQQAQAQRWAWWLILYPSVLLFVIMLLGVFVGEGIRDAFDAKRQSRIEG